MRPVAILLQAFMPESMDRLMDQLGLPQDARKIASLESPMVEGVSLPAPAGIFPRYVETA
jgi:methionyl-tRNA synthetase